VTGVNIFPRKGIDKFGRFFIDFSIPNIINSVFLGFIRSLLEQQHSAIFLRSWERLNRPRSASDKENDINVFVSSTYDSTSQFETTLGKSFMYIVNSSGPKMEHCGTPRFTNKGVD
jgi:hypothetical protein